MGAHDEFKGIFEYYDTLAYVLVKAPDFSIDYLSNAPPTLDKIFDGLLNGFYLVEKTRTQSHYLALSN